MHPFLGGRHTSHKKPAVILMWKHQYAYNPHSCLPPWAIPTHSDSVSWGEGLLIAFTHIHSWNSWAFAFTWKEKLNQEEMLEYLSSQCHCTLTRRSPKQASRADGEKTDSLQGRSDDCIQTVWQSTLISPCWAVWCYWAQPCTSVSLQCTQWAKPTELMGNGRELRGRRRERGEEWMMCHTP